MSVMAFQRTRPLSIAQSLYEKKVTSYPVPAAATSPTMYLKSSRAHPPLVVIPPFCSLRRHIDSQPLNNRSVNAAKVTDHHALLVTENLPGDLSPDERTIYEMIAARMLESFSGKCTMERTSVTLQSAGVAFSVRGSVIKVPGWRAVLNLSDEEDEDSATLPELQQGDTLPVDKNEVLEKQTKPRPFHTESTLLAAMESAGRELENEEERQAMKEAASARPPPVPPSSRHCSAGTISVVKRNPFVPTEKGLAVYAIVKDKKIADISMTGSWESALAKIETGGMDSGHFSSWNRGLCRTDNHRAAEYRHLHSGSRRRSRLSQMQAGARAVLQQDSQMQQRGLHPESIP